MRLSMDSQKGFITRLKAGILININGVPQRYLFSLIQNATISRTNKDILVSPMMPCAFVWYHREGRRLLLILMAFLKE